MRKLIKPILIIALTPAGLILAFLLFTMSNDFRPKPEEQAILYGEGKPTAPGDSVFTFVTWNLGYLGLGMDNDFFFDGGVMSRPAEDNYRYCAGAVMDYLSAEEKADFYFFQEVDIQARRSYNENQVELLKIVFPGYQGVVAVNYKVPFVPVPLLKPMGRVKSGLAGFYRYQATGNQRYAFPRGYSWPVYLFMLDRCFTLSRISMPSGNELVLINTHNEAFDDGSHRAAQMALLKATMLAEYDKGNYVVAGGDWNMNPPGFDPASFTRTDPGKKILPAMEPGFFPPGWQWAFDPSAPTNRDVNQPYRRGKTPTTVIDFFVVSPNIEVMNVKTIDLGFECSDHQPVRMKVRLKDVPRN